MGPQVAAIEVILARLRLQISNDTVANQLVRVSVSLFAIAEERIVDLSTATLRIKAAQQRNSIGRNSELTLKSLGVNLLHHEKPINRSQWQLTDPRRPHLWRWRVVVQASTRRFNQR